MISCVKRWYRRYRKWKIPAEKKENLIAVLNISNKMVEIVVMLLSIYLISDLHDVPRSCRHIDCLNKYAAISDSAEPDFFVRACSQQREACRYSFADPALIRQAEQAGLVTPAIRNTYEAMMVYCRCMLEDHPESVYCNFHIARAVLFAYSILCISIMEMSTSVRGFRSPLIRFFSFFAVFILFGSALAYFHHANLNCGSFDFRISFRVIKSTCTASLIIVTVAFCAEMLGWRRAYAKAVLRFQDPGYNKDENLTRELGGVSLGHALASTLNSTASAAVPSARVKLGQPDDTGSGGMDGGDGGESGLKTKNGFTTGRSKRLRKVIRRQDTYDFSAYDELEGDTGDTGDEEGEDSAPEDIFDEPQVTFLGSLQEIAAEEEGEEQGQGEGEEAPMLPTTDTLKQRLL